MHERIIGLYEENAEAWDRQRGRDLFEAPQLDRFVSLLAAGASILDLGCGMGEPIGRWLIERGFAVTGVDSSPSLIALARERFPEQEWIVGDMRRLALGRSFGAILAWHSFFHLSQQDQERIFPIFADHSAPGAILMFTSGPERGEAIGSWQGEPLYHSSLDPEEYRALLAANGFSVLDYRPRDPEIGDATIWLARYD